MGLELHACMLKFCEIKHLHINISMYLIPCLYKCSQPAHNAIITSSLRPNDVADVVWTQWRRYHCVIIASCVRWVPSPFSFYEWQRKITPQMLDFIALLCVILTLSSVCKAEYHIWHSCLSSDVTIFNFVKGVCSLYSTIFNAFHSAPNTENRELLWCQFCRHCWQLRLSFGSIIVDSRNDHWFQCIGFTLSLSLLK